MEVKQSLPTDTVDHQHTSTSFMHKSVYHPTVAAGTSKVTCPVPHTKTDNASKPVITVTTDIPKRESSVAAPKVLKTANNKSVGKKKGCPDFNKIHSKLLQNQKTLVDHVNRNPQIDMKMNVAMKQAQNGGTTSVVEQPFAAILLSTTPAKSSTGHFSSANRPTTATKSVAKPSASEWTEALAIVRRVLSQEDKENNEISFSPKPKSVSSNQIMNNENAEVLSQFHKSLRLSQGITSCTKKNREERLDRFLSKVTTKRKARIVSARDLEEY